MLGNGLLQASIPNRTSSIFAYMCQYERWCALAGGEPMFAYIRIAEQANEVKQTNEWKRFQAADM